MPTKKKAKPNAPITLQIPNELIEQIDEIVDGGNYDGLRSREEAIVHFLRAGLAGEDGFPVDMQVG